MLPKYEIEVASRKITAITDTQIEHRYIGSERYEAPVKEYVTFKTRNGAFTKP